jgi:hypothetical protein
MNKQVLFVVLLLIITSAGGAAYMLLRTSGMGETRSVGAPANASASVELVEEEITLEEGNSGTITIPWVGVNFRNTDEKHHWDMPSGVLKVVATLTWYEEGWELDFSIGVGDCPHHGERKNGSVEDDGEIVVEYTDPGGEPLEEGEWFAHISTVNKNEKRGESCDYIIKIVVYRLEK